MNKKIILAICFLVFLIGGILTWQYLMPQEETRAPEEIVPKNEIAGWNTHRNDEYGFEIKYPGELETRWRIINNETAGGCVMGEQVRFYFYAKGEAPPLESEWGIGGFLFEGSLTSADYQNLEISTKDGSSCGPVFDFPLEKIVLETPFQLLSTSLTASKPLQAMSCDINQTAKFSVGRYYNGKYNTFELQFYLEDLWSEDWLETAERSDWDWRTECHKTFQENIQELEARIRQFDLVAKSLKYLEGYKQN